MMCKTYFCVTYKICKIIYIPYHCSMKKTFLTLGLLATTTFGADAQKIRNSATKAKNVPKIAWSLHTALADSLKKEIISAVSEYTKVYGYPHTSLRVQDTAI